MPLPRFLVTLAVLLTTAFSCHADLPTLTVLHTFSAGGPDDLVPSHHANSDGSRPEAPLLQGHDGTWYGTTSSGGVNGTGIIFKMQSDGAKFTVLHSFGPLTAFFGNETNADGCWPQGVLIFGQDGALYGATSQGGPGGSGTIFRLNLDGTGFAVLHSFEPKGEMFHNHGGASPIGLTVGPDQALYGVAELGGDGRGLIFRLTLDGKDFRVLHSFGNTEYSGTGNLNQGGAIPNVAVTFGYDSLLYGTANIGGRYGYGVIYKMGADGKHFQVLHEFQRKVKADGVFPDGPLAAGIGGALYGCTRQGGEFDGGILYKIGTDGTGFTVLHAFQRPGSQNTDGDLPVGPLALGPDKYVYGLSGGGGEQGTGTVFKVSTDGTQFLTLRSFSMTEGGYTLTGLTLGHDGNLYGLSTNGGTNGNGTIFRVTLPISK